MMINNHHNNVYGYIVVQLCFSLFFSLSLSHPHSNDDNDNATKKKTFDFGKSTTTTTEKFYDMDFFVCSLEKRNHFLFYSHLNRWMDGKKCNFLMSLRGWWGKMKIVNILTEKVMC